MSRQPQAEDDKCKAPQLLDCIHAGGLHVQTLPFMSFKERNLCMMLALDGGPCHAHWLLCLLQECADSSHPRLAVTFLSAAAHLAQIEAGMGSTQASGSLLGHAAGAGFHSQTGLPGSFTAALTWPAVRGAFSGEVDISPSAIRYQPVPRC